MVWTEGFDGITKFKKNVSLKIDSFVHPLNYLLITAKIYALKINYIKAKIDNTVKNTNKIRIYEIDIGIEKYAKHRRLSWFRYETFITFFKLRFFDTRSERHNFSMLTVRLSSALNSLIQPTRVRTP